MQASLPPERLDLEGRIHRSQGRSGRTYSATVRLTRDELTELETTAKSQQKAVGEWARELLLREARRPVDDPLMTEVTAIRMVLMLLLRPLLLKQAVTPEWIADSLATVRRDKRKATQDVMQQYRDDAAGGR